MYICTIKQTKTNIMRIPRFITNTYENATFIPSVNRKVEDDSIKLNETSFIQISEKGKFSAFVIKNNGNIAFGRETFSLLGAFLNVKTLSK